LLKKILVIRFSSIGDIVLTTPVLRILHEQADAEIHYLTKPAFASIVLSNPYVKKVITLGDELDRLILLLKEEQYDHIIDLHHNLRSTRIKLALRRPSASFDKRNFQKWLMVRLKKDTPPVKHIVDRYIETINFLGVSDDEKGLDFFIPTDKKIDVKAVFEFDAYAAIVIGAAHETKCMTVAQLAKLCELLDMPVILLGGKQEEEKANAIIATSKSKFVKSACGPFDIFQSASILEQASTIITHDTGLMHIAAALKKPQIVVWGNTIPEFGMQPHYGAQNVKWDSFEILGLPCRPCSKLGFPKCPRGHFRCMLEHDLKSIAEAALKLILLTPC